MEDFMKRGMAQQLLLFSLFASMSENSMEYNRKPIQKRIKPIILKTCPICKTEHTEINRFCSEDCRLINKKKKKAKKSKRKHKH